MSEIVPRPFCRHCGRVFVCRPRGLCWVCFYRPGVRDLYPVDAKYGRRGSGVANSNSPLSQRPTGHLPGSRRKKEVLKQRAAKGLALFHPDDGACNLE